jgi:hypothetical protein
LLAIQHHLQSMLSLVVHERGQSARPVVLYEQAVLDVRVGLPEKGYSDRIAPHHRIEKAFRLLRIPNEVALDCRQHDFTACNLVQNTDDWRHSRYLKVTTHASQD